MFATFQRLINEMVPGGGLQYSHVDRETWQVILKSQSSEVPFDGVSQGMSSILNWVGLLLQRLYEVYPRSEAPEREPAVVLVDEIDAHLHPEWQRRLVALTKEHFPNVQVIASSHSPLLAGAVSHEELRVVAPNPRSGEVEASIPRENVSGQKAEDILVSSLFSLHTTRSIEAEKTIERYFQLFGKSSVDSTEQAELDDLQAKLKSLNYGATLEQRQQIEQMRSQIDSSMQVVSTDTAEALRRRFGAQPSPEQSR
jgi:predicted ATP-binding protein involved in virulence